MLVHVHVYVQYMTISVLFWVWDGILPSCVLQNTHVYTDNTFNNVHVQWNSNSTCNCKAKYKDLCDCNVNISGSLGLPPNLQNSKTHAICNVHVHVHIYNHKHSNSDHVLRSSVWKLTAHLFSIEVVEVSIF